jgi:hypothetical protein
MPQVNHSFSSTFTTLFRIATVKSFKTFDHLKAPAIAKQPPPQESSRGHFSELIIPAHAPATKSRTPTQSQQTEQPFINLDSKRRGKIRVSADCRIDQDLG